ncbi:hypothetical protein N2152v2_009394 [Parachlorella kessleri]
MGERTVGEWVISTHIGSGSFAIVWKARHRLTGQESAIKEIALDKLNSKLRQSLESEVSILKRINHDNIVKLLEVFEEKSKLYLIMEYCAGGDLAHYIRAHKRVPEAVAQHFMQQLAAGLREMWSHHLVHRDLKPQNLLLEGPGPLARLKIADFGFARNLQPQGLAETLCGSPLYMAPEILHFHKYDAKADLWSVGAILFELVAGRPPFNGANQFQLLRNIERGEARLPDSVASQLSLPCRQLIHALLRRNPVERISFEEFFRHPFLTNPAPPMPTPLSPFDNSLVPLVRSSSANSIPQQVLGFKQVPLAPSGNGADGTTGPGGTAAGIAGPPPVVPPGGLSNQLKQRRSLDLDGVTQRGQQLQQAQQVLGAASRLAAAAMDPGATAAVAGLLPQPPQQQQQQPTVQRGVEPEPAWVQQIVSHHQQHPRQATLQGPVGSLCRQGISHLTRAGFGAAAAVGVTPLGSAPPAVHALLAEGSPLGPRRVGTPSPVMGGPVTTAYAHHGGLSARGASPASATPAHRAYPPAAAETAAPYPSRPTHQQQQQRNAAAGSTARSTLGQGWGAAGAAPVALGPGESTHSIDDDYVLVDTVASSRSQQQPSPAPPESPASGTASLEGSLHTRPADEVFTVTTPEVLPTAEPDSTWPTHPAPWLAGSEDSGSAPPRWHVLRRAAQVIELLAVPRPEQAPEQCLSLCLAALQLLELALDALAAALPGSTPAAAGVSSSSKAEEKLRKEILRVLGRAEGAAEALALAQQQGSVEAPAQGALPDPWELCYHLALGLAKEAAVDELLGNLEHSLQLYAKACCLLHFLCTEGPGLALEPPLQLTAADQQRLHRYAAATSARWAACKAQLDVEEPQMEA